ncbi:MAG TPA: hypothetical protein VG388_14070 [Solirubrobacteraceae bacterium]|jgi:hypothetical protein|nr:hypothetical protein [Solirubrobacteraceae bacterium]
MIHLTQLRTSLALASASAALLAAGCGETSPTSANAGGGPAGDAAAAYKFSRCMRQHGLPNFPDPKVINQPGHQGVGIHVTPATTGGPNFKTAQKACAGIMPGAGNGNGPSAQERAAHLKGLLSFATCMRDHHVPGFPDPNTQGQITPQMLSAAGLNLHAPAVKAAAMTCVPASQGQVSAAAVAQAVNGAGSGSSSAGGG